jgi:hypothetical protein
VNSPKFWPSPDIRRYASAGIGITNGPRVEQGGPFVGSDARWGGLVPGMPDIFHDADRAIEEVPQLGSLVEPQESVLVRFAPVIGDVHDDGRLGSILALVPR